MVIDYHPHSPDDARLPEGTARHLSSKMTASFCGQISGLLLAASGKHETQNWPKNCRLPAGINVNFNGYGEDVFRPNYHHYQEHNEAKEQVYPVRSLLLQTRSENSEPGYVNFVKRESPVINNSVPKETGEELSQESVNDAPLDLSLKSCQENQATPTARLGTDSKYPSSRSEPSWTNTRPIAVTTEEEFSDPITLLQKRFGTQQETSKSETANNYHHTSHHQTLASSKSSRSVPLSEVTHAATPLADTSPLSCLQRGFGANSEHMRNIAKTASLYSVFESTPPWPAITSKRYWQQAESQASLSLQWQNPSQSQMSQKSPGSCGQPATSIKRSTSSGMNHREPMLSLPVIVSNGGLNSSCRVSSPMLQRIDPDLLPLLVCECSKRFDTLYYLTAHMYETGHCPPNLLVAKENFLAYYYSRAQPSDVTGLGANASGPVQAKRERAYSGSGSSSRPMLMLPCRRCAQLFASLPELTAHLLATKHHVIEDEPKSEPIISPEICRPREVLESPIRQKTSRGVSLKRTHEEEGIQHQTPLNNISSSHYKIPSHPLENGNRFSSDNNNTVNTLSSSENDNGSAKKPRMEENASSKSRDIDIFPTVVATSPSQSALQAMENFVKQSLGGIVSIEQTLKSVEDRAKPRRKAGSGGVKRYGRKTPGERERKEWRESNIYYDYYSSERIRNWLSDTSELSRITPEARSSRSTGLDMVDTGSLVMQERIAGRRNESEGL